MAAVTWSVIKVIIPIFIIYRSAEPMVSYLLIYCHSPSLLETKFPITICLKRLASRQNMQTQLDTKSSCVASGLPARCHGLFVILYVWILSVLRDISLRWEVGSSAPAYVFIAVLYVCLFVSHPLHTSLFHVFFCIYLLHISLPTEVWRSLFLFPSTSLSLLMCLL